MSRYFTVFIILAAAVLLAACAGGGRAESAAAGATDAAEPSGGSDAASSDAVSPESPAKEIYEAEYLSVIDGLHVTGTPVEVDIETYRLVVEGAVQDPLELSFDEIQAMASERIYAELECPGFFVDVGHWTGVPLATILEKAGAAEGAGLVSFTSLDGWYTKRIPLERVREDGFLISWAFNDKTFQPVHGYPLRLVAPGQPGYNWVKWLGKITVS